MSNMDSNNPNQNQASPDTIVTYFASLVQYLGELIDILEGAFPRIVGKFTTTATVTQAIPAPTITANAEVMITPANAAAGTLQSGASALYVAFVTAGVGFTVATSNGAAATAGAIFSYQVTNPV
jgi:hypothetical protein